MGTAFVHGRSCRQSRNPKMRPLKSQSPSQSVSQTDDPYTTERVVAPLSYTICSLRNVLFAFALQRLPASTSGPSFPTSLFFPTPHIPFSHRPSSFSRLVFAFHDRPYPHEDADVPLDFDVLVETLLGLQHQHRSLHLQFLVILLRLYYQPFQRVQLPQFG